MFFVESYHSLRLLGHLHFFAHNIPHDAVKCSLIADIEKHRSRVVFAAFANCGNGYIQLLRPCGQFLQVGLIKARQDRYFAALFQPFKADLASGQVNIHTARGLFLYPLTFVVNAYLDKLEYDLVRLRDHLGRQRHPRTCYIISVHKHSSFRPFFELTRR